MGVVAHSSFTQRGIEARKALLLKQARAEDKDMIRLRVSLRYAAKMKRFRIIDRAVARAAAANLPPRLHRPSLRVVMDRIARVFGFHRNDIIGVGRARRLVLARQAFCYWARRLTGKSLLAIGRFVERDHTTVLHAITDYPRKRQEMARHVRPLR